MEGRDPYRSATKETVPTYSVYAAPVAVVVDVVVVEVVGGSDPSAVHHYDYVPSGTVRVGVITQREHFLPPGKSFSGIYMEDTTSGFTHRDSSPGVGYGVEFGLSEAASASGRPVVIAKSTTADRVAVIEQELVDHVSPTIIDAFYGDKTPGPITLGSITSTFGGVVNYDREERGTWVVEGEDVLMKTKHPAGGAGYPASGLSFHKYFTPIKEGWSTYDHRLDPGYDPQSSPTLNGGKMPGFVGEISASAGSPADGTRASGFSARAMWKGQTFNTDIPAPQGFYYGYQYAYHKNQPGPYGDNWPWVDPDTGELYLFKVGSWYRIRQRIKMNTTTGVLGGGSPDGEAEVWVSEVDDFGQALGFRKVLSRSDIVWTDEVNDIGQWFQNNHIGGGVSWAPVVDQYASFKRFVVYGEEPSHTELTDITAIVPAPGQPYDLHQMKRRRLVRGDDHIIVLVGRDDITWTETTSLLDGLATAVDARGIDLTSPEGRESLGTLLYAAIAGMEAARDATTNSLLVSGEPTTTSAYEGVPLKFTSGYTTGGMSPVVTLQSSGSNITSLPGREYTPTYSDVGSPLRLKVSLLGTTLYSGESLPVRAKMRGFRFNRGRYLRGPSISLAAGADWTVTMWVNVVDITSANALISCWSSGLSGIFLNVFDSGSSELWRWRAETNANSDWTSPGLLNTWTHVALRYDSVGGYTQLLIDGEMVRQRPAPTPFAGASGPLVIGGREDAGAAATAISNASIADVRVYSEAKDDVSVAHIMSGGADGVSLVASLGLTGSDFALPPGWTEEGTGTVVDYDPGPEAWLQ